MSDPKDEIEYRPIPFFRRYAISKKGVIINISTKKVAKERINPWGGIQVCMIMDTGTRTTRTPKILVEEIWGDK